MPIILEESGTWGKIALWEITESYEELENSAQPDAFEKALVEKVNNVNRKLELLTTRSLVNSLMGEKVSVHYKKGRIPFLTSGDKYISITHSAKHVAVLISDKQNIGVDLERIATRVRRIKHKFVSESEASFIESDKEIEYLTVLWSAKEAIYKMMHHEGVDFIEQINIHPFKLDKCGVLVADFKINDEIYPIELHYKLIDNLVLVFNI